MAETEITIFRKTHDLKEGEIIVVTSGEPHALKAIKRFKVMLVVIEIP
jgi:quercetin dioxygenase-like cupin family protein